MLLGSSIFLLPNGTYVVELVLFLVFLGIIAKFVLRPIQEAMQSRAERVRSALRAGDEGQAEADRLAAERSAVLEQARAEARALLEEAGNRATELFEAGRHRGQEEHDRVLVEAQPRLDAERRAVEQELLGRMGDLVVAAAERVVGEPVDVAKHRGVLESAVAQAVGAAGGAQAVGAAGGAQAVGAVGSESGAGDGRA